MKILLFGVSNVGKTTTGLILAKLLSCPFYDLDEEVKKRLGITLEEFVNTNNLAWRDAIRVSIIKDIVRLEGNFVFSISPISYIGDLKDIVNRKDVLAIELYDTVENIFSRLVFSDENDCINTDDAYKYEHMEHYLNDIEGDLEWYGDLFKTIGITNRVFVDNRIQSVVAKEIVSKYKLK